MIHIHNQGLRKIGCDMRSVDDMTGDPNVEIILLRRDHMVNHPACAYYALWNGPAYLDIGGPAGEFARFAVANLTTQWGVLMDGQNQPLPVAARYDGRGLAISWLPYDGSPGKRPNAQIVNGLSDADLSAAREKLSATRYESLNGLAWGIGGSSTYRQREILVTSHST